MLRHKHTECGNKIKREIHRLPDYTFIFSEKGKHTLTMGPNWTTYEKHNRNRNIGQPMDPQES